MTGTELDEILADDGQQETTEQQTTETTTQTETEGQARDEHGRFTATKAEEGQQEQPQTEEQQGDPEVGDDGKVPQQALHASRQREKEVKAENDTLRQQLQQMSGQIEMLSRQVSQPREQQSKTEAPQKPDFWEDPENFVKSAVSPIEQSAQQRFEQFSKMMAVDKHGAEKVDAAFDALVEAGQRGDPQAKADYQSIMAHPHPYGALVEWHQKRETLNRVGNDPNAFVEAEIERRMADPEFIKAMTARITGQAQPQAGQTPVTKLPPSLGRIPAGTNQPADDDVSDEALFSNALR